jgi:uncharacterized protein DUF2569
MQTPDIHQLAESYRRMSDGEILRLAADVDSLTDQARAALAAELRRRSLDVPTAPAATPESPAKAPPSGIGGWLLLFCLALLAQPFFCLVEAAADDFELRSSIFSLLFGAMAISIGISLLSRAKVALTLVKWWLLLNAILALLVFLGSIGDAGRLGYNTDRIARSLGYVAIWFPYFKKSKRVLNTFGRNI